MTDGEEKAVVDEQELARQLADVRKRAAALASRVAEFQAGDEEPEPQMDDAPPAAAAPAVRRTGGSRFGAWLFERRPEPDADPVPESGAEAVARPEAVRAPVPEPDPAPQPEPVAEPDPVAEPEPVAEAEPAAEAEPDPEPAAEPEPQLVTPAEPVSITKRARPRPSPLAPVVFAPPAGKAGEPDPVDAFFNRTDDDEPTRWWRRRRDDDSSREAGKAERPRKDDKPADRPADKPADKRSRAPWPAALRALRRTVIVVAIAVLAAVLMRAYVVAPYYVPSASMEPTLHGCPGCNNDHVLVEKLSYRFHDVQPGDVVVFNRPSTWDVPDKVLIKRVVGVSGDRLVVKGGHVYRNGHLLEEPYVNQKCRPGTTASPGSTSTRRHAFATIPNGDVFVMGDNRCDSEDSRVFGVVPADKIIGRAFLIVWPFSRWHSL